MPRSNQQSAKDLAKAAAIEAKRMAKERMQSLKNPSPQYVEPPESTGDLEKDAEAVLDSVQKGFRERAKLEADRFRLATDSEFWTAICFQTREQKEVFLNALGLLSHGDKYLDGQVVAEVLGVKLPQANVPYNKSARIDKSWLEFTQ